MLSEKVYVRCPADQESATDPRVFVCGQIKSIDEFNKTVLVKIHDPFGYLQFFEDLPSGIIELPISAVDHCRMFIGSEVVVKGDICRVLTVQKSKDDVYHYYVQTLEDKRVFRISEKDITASFTNGDIDPAEQLKRYEFQNPCWFMGHSVVSRSMNILDNSIYGFKTLAGSKIYLLPHQINTIMRCLQESPCRFMLADEVGMGKTVEAISVLKIYTQDNAYKNVLVIVPPTLKVQWQTELLLKFGIPVGEDINNNTISLKTIDEITEADIAKNLDFVIVDEVHRYLSNQDNYALLHNISRRSENVLFLSATPVQQRKEEYLELLRLLQPRKYDAYDVDQFEELITKQGHIIQKTTLVLDNLADYIEELDAANESNENPLDSDDCQELYNEIYETLDDICQDLDDNKLTSLMRQIHIDSLDHGVYGIKVIISYICSNYQVESNIIRNRRKILEVNDDGTRLLPVRELREVSYALDSDRNTQETICYQYISDWLSRDSKELCVSDTIRPVLGTFFSSPWAFIAQLQRLTQTGISIDRDLVTAANLWAKDEEFIILNLKNILDDPDAYEDESCSRIVTIFDLLYDELYDAKVVLFTNYTETFNAYRKGLENVFPPAEISFFAAGMEQDDLELNAYRFQNESTCRIMLCDSLGGEGRNFQCADYIIHIDLPWDANMIEQRIGRLDRLERDSARSIVTSVVIHSQDTFEEALFNFWSKGLKIFNQSLSGMEIIMKDINDEIVAAVEEDFKYGLFERVAKINQLADTMRDAVRKEQNYDAAGFMYRPMHIELKRLLDYYAQNENELFASSMTNWARLAGFKGFSGKSGTITYTAASFSPKAAINSQLIPPRWDEYLSLEQNKFVNGVIDAYERSKQKKTQDRFIRGTFSRKQAIENDYLHFFAPGDNIYDCIVNNAIRSCKGRSSAFAAASQYNWRGLIFTWSIAPNEAYLYDHGISGYALGPYRNYLISEQVTVVISLDNPESISDAAIEREYSRIIKQGYNEKSIIHLGQRGHMAAALKGKSSDKTSIEWFRNRYPEEEWLETINDARKKAYEIASGRFQRRLNIKGAKEEMERALSARVANAEFYGFSDDKIESMKSEYATLLEAIRQFKITLDSAAFVWMTK